MNKLKFIFLSLIDAIIFYYYKIIFFVSNKKYNDVWLISERGNEARDNGYWFYYYMKKNHPEVVVKYVITKDSPDYHKIDKNDVILYRSKEHYYYFLYSKYLISAQIMGFSPNERLFYRLNKYGFIKLRGKTVFLQHGITKDYNEYLLKKNTKLDLFICGAIPECDYVRSEFGYSEKEAVCTGLARFDNLIDLNEKMILVMPTWRKYLNYTSSIKESLFFKSYMELLNDNDIISLLKKNNIKMIFYPHVLMQKYLKEFSSDSEFVILADYKQYDVQDLLKKCSILITDFSSVAFDLAYMRKKTLYYQFDLDEYRKTQYSDGYYSYEKDGFGPVLYNYNELKNILIQFINNPDSLNNFNKRIDAFFLETDFLNSERIYDNIIKMG